RPPRGREPAPPPAGSGGRGRPRPGRRAWRSRARSWADPGGSGRLEHVCGRYVNAAATGDLVDEFDVEETLGEDLPPSFNIAPTDPVRVVVERPPHGDEHGGRQLRTVRWGLVPSWSKDAKGGARMINARI